MYNNRTRPIKDVIHQDPPKTKWGVHDNEAKNRIEYSAPSIVNVRYSLVPRHSRRRRNAWVQGYVRYCASCINYTLIGWTGDEKVYIYHAIIIEQPEHVKTKV